MSQEPDFAFNQPPWQSIGIVGVGFVGRAVKHGFSPWCDVKCYDADPRKSTHEFAEVMACDFVFVCLPTPQSVDGSCDTAIVEAFCSQVAGCKQPLIFKSTMPPGTTDRLASEYNLLAAVHCPEFLTARTAIVDFLTPSRIIVGMSKPPHNALHWGKARNAIKELFRNRFPGVQVIEMSAVESELVKYGCNCFFATKVAFFNELKQIVDASGGSWKAVHAGMLSDGRIAHSHTDVPGHDGKLGFGGACLPKDLAAMVTYAGELDVPVSVMSGAQAANATVRPEEYAQVRA